MKLILNDSYLERKHKYFKDVAEADWNNWKWQVANRITTAKDLLKYIPLTVDEEKTVNDVENLIDSIIRN